MRSLHSRCKDQILGTNETVVKYEGQYPASWGEVRQIAAEMPSLFKLFG